MKKILSMALILAMCVSLALASGCNKPKDDKETTSDTGKVEVENIYGSSDLTADMVEAFQNSGEITIYTDKSDIAKGNYDEDQQAYVDWMKKYYGLTINYKYQAYGDDLTKFLVDFANGDAPDYISLNYRRWPKAGNRQIVYSVSELEELGVIGLDHPQFEKYKSLQQPFYIGDECYSPVAVYCDPVVVGVNLDLFDRYSVKSPVEYYKEGNWNMDTYIQCCKELTRTLQDDTKIWGAYGWNYSWYLVANDARLVKWDSNWKLALTMNEPSTIATLTTIKDLYDKGYSPSAEQYSSGDVFISGTLGMLLFNANNMAQRLAKCTFNWDIVPMPYGSNNTSGLIPGEISGAGIVTSTKNPQGVINFLIASKIYHEIKYNVDMGLYYIATYEGIYNDEQLAMIQSYADKVDQDIYMGVGALNNNQYKFWNDLKGGAMTVKEVIDTYESSWRAHVDDENAQAVRK